MTRRIAAWLALGVSWGATWVFIKVGQAVVRDGLPDAEGERVLLLEPLPEAGRAEPAVLVVHARDAACVHDPHAGAHGGHGLVGGARETPLLEAPTGMLAPRPDREEMDGFFATRLIRQ